MVAGHHLIFTAYGWWLPNDPRGSSSHEIRMDHIVDLGELHYGRKHVQPSSRELRRFYEQAKDVLKHPLLLFEEHDFELIADSFAQVVHDRRYTCYACAIMPDHVHMLIRKHRDHGETMMELLREKSGVALIQAGRRAPAHPVWGGPGWNVFQFTREDLERTIKYIRNNPIKIGLPAQRWSFVKEYDGWMPGWWKPRPP
jgi:REP-associated tyrosine transposase